MCDSSGLMSIRMSKLVTMTMLITVEMMMTVKTKVVTMVIDMKYSQGG